MEGVVTARGGLRARFSLRRSESFRLELTLLIPPGRTVALLGPNGAGKSTAVAALAGLLPIDEGIIELDGTVLDDPARDVLLPAKERRVGVVFQDYLLFPHLSVVENVAFGLRTRGVHHDDALTRSRDWLARLGLTGLERHKPGQLSGGQAQGVALARALVTGPDLLLLDEPLSALDITTRARLRRTLAEHLEEFTGPRVVITHDPSEAFLISDEIHVLEGGVVTQVGTADEIRLRPRTSYVADLAGSNLFVGHAANGLVAIGDHRLQIADSRVAGEVLVTIQPQAVSLFRSRPEGSPRNVWKTEIEMIEDLGDRVRLRIGPPLALTAELTSASKEVMGLARGLMVWVAVKATEIRVEGQESTG
ncbi:MAG: ABC transporter ATP-binding protein [Acidimicrobiia bacterium]